LLWIGSLYAPRFKKALSARIAVVGNLTKIEDNPVAADRET